MRIQRMSWRDATWWLLPAICLTMQARANPSLDEAAKLLEQAQALDQQQRFDAGIASARRALEISEASAGAEHPQTAAALTLLCRLHHGAGNLPLAKQHCLRALAIRERLFGQQHRDTASTLQALGELSRAVADYPEAERLFLRVIGIREQVLGSEDPAVASSLNSLALTQYAMGNYAQAEPLYQRALAIREKQLGAEHPDTIATLDCMARLQATLGNIPAAEALSLQVLALREKVLRPGHPQIATVLSQLGQLYATSGDYRRAEPMYRRALTILEAELDPMHPLLAHTLYALATLHQDTGAYGAAEPLMRRALAIYESKLPPGHPSTIVVLSALARLHQHLGKLSSASALYARMHRSIEESALDANPDVLFALNSAGIFHASTGELGKAARVHGRVLAARERMLGKQHPQTIESTGHLAMAHWALGDTAGAMRLLERALEARAKYSAQLLAFGPESRKQAYLRDIEHDLFKAVSFSVTAASQRSAALGLSAVLQYKGRGFDAMSDAANRLRRSIEPADRALFQELTEIAAQLSTLIYQGTGSLSAQEYQQRLAKLTCQQEVLEAQISRRSGEFQRQVAPATLAAIRGAIPADAALIEWFRYLPFDPKRDGLDAQWGAPRYAAFVLTRAGTPRAIDLGPADTIEAQADALRVAASDPQRNDVRQVAAALSERLLAPLRSELRGATHLLLSPDGVLNLVPMAALLDERGDYLVRSHQITYLTSGRDLLRVSAGGAGDANERTVLVADPDFGAGAPGMPLGKSQLQRSEEMDRGGLTFRPLPGTSLEAQALQSLLKLADADVLVRLEANESRLKQLVRPRILHMATHGFFLSDQEFARTLRPPREASTSPPASDRPTENPLLRSGVALAGANMRASGATEDGVLTALEMSQLDLLGTELVVLSACQTGMGAVRNGDGVYGLRRALVLAGAQSHVTSLWRVADTATKDLMVDYYQRLLRGTGRSASLRDTQRSMLASPLYSHPYYWAGFIAGGNWKALPSPHFSQSGSARQRQHHDHQ